MTQFWFFLSIWITLSLIGRILMIYRSDYGRLVRDWTTIKNKRVFGIVLLIMLMVVFLPFSIPYSIGNIKNNRKTNK